MYVGFAGLIECTLTSVLRCFLLLLLDQLELDNRRSNGLNLVLPIRFLLTFKSTERSSLLLYRSRYKAQVQP